MSSREESSDSQSLPSRPRGRPAGRTSADGVIADRNFLLATAEALIRKQGPTISLQAVALNAGVTKPTLYREVGDRDALVKALAERLAMRMSESILAGTTEASGPREALRMLVSRYIEFAAQERHLYLFVTAGGNGDDRVDQSLQLADRAVSQFAESIASYRNAQGADAAVATAWSYGIVGALHFVTLWWLRESTSSSDLVVEQITSLLWSGISH